MALIMIAILFVMSLVENKCFEERGSSATALVGAPDL